MDDALAPSQSCCRIGRQLLLVRPEDGVPILRKAVGIVTNLKQTEKSHRILTGKTHGNCISTGKTVSRPFPDRHSFVTPADYICRSREIGGREMKIKNISLPRINLADVTCHYAITEILERFLNRAGVPGCKD
jgi:hypothetical protein